MPGTAAEQSATHPICPHCKESEVFADAYAYWDVEIQDWVVCQTFDNYICDNRDCAIDCEIKPEWVAA